MNPETLMMPLYFLQAAHGAEQRGLWDTIVHSNVINFLIALTILTIIVKKFNLLGAVSRHQEKIRKEVELAEHQRKKAQEQLEVIQKRTANLSREVENILQEARASAETLSNQILEEARSEADKIVDSSRRRVELEQRAAMRHIEAKLLNDALTLAHEELQTSMTPSEQRRTVDAFLEELSGKDLGVQRR